MDLRGVSYCAILDILKVGDGRLTALNLTKVIIKIITVELKLNWLKLSFLKFNTNFSYFEGFTRPFSGGSRISRRRGHQPDAVTFHKICMSK